MDILAADRLVVDVVGRLVVAAEHPLDREFGEAGPDPADAAQGVVEHQFHRGPRGRLAVDRAREDDVLHRLAAQLRSLGLTQHPAHRVDDVRLAAAVGAHHAHALAGHLEGGGIDEGLEARQLDLLESHARNTPERWARQKSEKPRWRLRPAYTSTRPPRPRRFPANPARGFWFQGSPPAGRRRPARKAVRPCPPSPASA